MKKNIKEIKGISIHKCKRCNKRFFVVSKKSTLKSNKNVNFDQYEYIFYCPRCDIFHKSKKREKIF